MEPVSDVNNGTEPTVVLSKRAQKKLVKKEKQTIIKKLRRAHEKADMKKRNAEKRERGEPIRVGPSRKELKRNKANDTPSIIKVAIDLTFDELMIEKDLAKCSKQLLWIYSTNRRSQRPIPVHFTGLKEENRLYKHLQKHDGWRQWDITAHEKPFNEIFDKSKIIYLSSESDNVLDVLEPDAVYIIGGLVDHNFYKGKCLKLAQDQDIRHVRLPLSEHVDIRTRTVLTINQVFEILLRVSEGMSWKETLLKILPMRKRTKNDTDEEMEEEKKPEVEEKKPEETSVIAT
ncbi:unnamed protein product [Diamesa hyperborea]